MVGCIVFFWISVNLSIRLNEHMPNSGIRGRGQHVYLFSEPVANSAIPFTNMSWMEVCVVGANTEAQSIHVPGGSMYIV